VSLNSIREEDSTNGATPEGVHLLYPWRKLGQCAATSQSR